MTRSAHGRTFRAMLAAAVAGVCVAGCTAGGVDVPGTGKYVDALKTSEKAPRPPVNERLTLRPFLQTDAGVVYEPVVSVYAERILTKLEAQWPGPKPAAHVYLVVCDGFKADASAAGGIVLSTGVLDYFRKNPRLADEDHLAFILAHELAHVLLGHPGDRDTTSKWVHSVSALVTVGAIFAGAGNTATKALGPAQYALLSNIAGIEIADGAIFPAWGRAQELQADALGIDLLARAGYAVSSAAEITDALEQGEAAMAEASAAQRAEIVHLTNNSISIKPAPYLMELWTSMGKSHPDGGERTRKVHEYVAREYDDVLVPLHRTEFQRILQSRPVTALLAGTDAVLAAARLNAAGQPAQALAKIRGAQHTPLEGAAITANERAMSLIMMGNVSAALATLETARQSADATEAILTLEGNILSENGRDAEALRVFKEIDARFDDPEIYPIEIHEMHRLKSPEENIIAVKCIAEGRPALMDRCAQAAKG